MSLLATVIECSAMKRIITALAFAGALTAQTTATVKAMGTATVLTSPDQVQISVSVMTDGSTAQAAAQANATLSTNVQNALKALNPAPMIQTTGYSVYPRYSNQGQTVTGYTASNTIRVTSVDLSATGNLIDTASQAGASSVSGLTFGLQNPDPIKQQALAQAAKQALADAGAIAAALAGKTGLVISAEEGSTYEPVELGGTAAKPATPIQTGLVNVTANVTLTVQFVTQ
jgi:uncharacterized protein YggE